MHYLLKILALILSQVAISHAEFNYCDVTSKPCPERTVRITYTDYNLDAYDVYKCVAQPLKLKDPTATRQPQINPEIDLQEMGEAQIFRPIKDGMEFVECSVSPDQTVYTYLKGLQTVHKNAGKYTLAVCLEQEFEGCFLDGKCYGLYTLNPKNLGEMCSENSKTTWYSIPADVPDESSAIVYIDVCFWFGENYNYTFEGTVNRAAGPFGIEGLDFTAKGSFLRSGDFAIPEKYSVSFSMRLYVKIHPEEPTETTTVFEVPSALKIQYGPSQQLAIEYTFTDTQLGNTTLKTVILRNEKGELNNDDDGWIQLIGVKMNNEVVKRSNTGLEGGWDMIGLGYDIRSGTTVLSWYLNGQEIKTDIGDLSGFQMRMGKSFKFSNAEVACFEHVGRLMDSDFFKDEDWCKGHYAGGPKDEYDKCEISFDNGIIPI